ncbi:hypothetical protein [Phytohabitans kaempferiae]|uniref:DUF4145 domain-containing protein n=1 Tax=Phytohabitans kaempferiae TaxID=1620943 RepID=A0ABV6LUN3_9ACTN
MSFPSDAPILDPVGIRNPPDGGQWLLWPAWCWRVLAPTSTDRRLDPFMSVIARLCQAGVTRSRELAARTMLHPDLCRQIMGLLQQQRLIDAKGNLTRQGTAALAGEAWDASTLRLVHVFQQPFGPPSLQRLWRAAAETLDYAHVDYGTGGGPRLRLDIRRDSPTVRPVVTRTRGIVRPRRPRPEEIVVAARSGADAGKPAPSGTGAAPDEPATVSPAQISRVSFVAEQPDPVLLTTYVYLPEDAMTSADWEVLDPFSGWPDPFLKESLRLRVPEDAGLAALVSGIEGQLSTGDAAARQAEYMRQRAEAAVVVEHRLGASVHQRVHGQIFKLLVEVEASLAEARLLGAVGGRRRQTAVNDAGKVLEHVFAGLCTRYPISPSVLTTLRHDDLGPSTLEDGLNRARDLLGIGAVPGGMRRLAHDQVARAGDGHLPSFRPVVVAALLACLEHAGHPLRGALRRRPDLCDRLDRATYLRNDGAHKQDREPTAEEADEVVDATYWTVSHLLLYPTTSEGV